jgi:hypothetical protein
MFPSLGIRKQVVLLAEFERIALVGEEPKARK